MFMPFQILGLWFRALLSLLLAGAAITLLGLWFANRQVTIVDDAPRPEPAQASNRGQSALQDGQETRLRTVSWEFGWNKETAYLLGGIALLAWSLGGGFLLSPRLWRKSVGRDQPRAETSHKVDFIRRPDGSELCVATYGPAEADPIIFTHGWGLDSNEWYYAKRELGAFRVITWDLPGLGRSTRPGDRDWSLEKLARDLDAVIAFAGSRPVTLVGHSIGTMIALTYCKLFPEALGARVARIVLAHGTYTNPVRTCTKPRLYTALQKPVLEPLCHLMVWLSPALRILNWLSYLNGSAHRSTERDSFSGQETREQLDFITRFYCKAPPDVLARGMLGMFRYDATNALAGIPIPVLIVAGDRDGTCTPEASRTMAERIPGSTMVTLANAKHCGLFEWHGEFHEAVVDFLSTAGRERAPIARGSSSFVSSSPRSEKSGPRSTSY